MTVRGSCVPFDRLAALALTAPDAHSDHDRQLLAHVARCDSCAASLAVLTTEIDTLREAAWDEADAIFDDQALEAQRARILDRLSHIGKAARVLHFPGRARETAMPVSPISRRWVSVAAAAGLIIGLVAGQLIHFVPGDLRLNRTAAPAAQASSSRGPIIVQATTTLSASADDELLDAVREAVLLPRAASLRALDAFTPRVGETFEIR